MAIKKRSSLELMFVMNFWGLSLTERLFPSLVFWLSRVLAIAAVILLLFPTALAQQPAATATIRVIAQDEMEKAVAGVQVQLKGAGTVVTTAVTDEKGEALLANLLPGTYEIVVSQEAFETLTQSGIAATAGTLVEVKFTLVPKIKVKEEIRIEGSAVTPIEQGASPATSLQGAEAKQLPNKATQVSDALPMIPGVVRTYQGELKISGSSEHRSAFIVNAADVTDPATGQFGMTVPVDIVQKIDVFKTPFLAQYGRFTAGVVSVETRRGGDKWNFELNDPFPEFRYLNGRLRGLRSATPRLVFNGPLIGNRLYLSEGIEYAIKKIPIKTLAYPDKETITRSINSFTQLDYIISPSHTLTGTFHLAPQRNTYANLSFFDQRPVTPNLQKHDYTGTVIDRLALGAHLFENTVAIKYYDANVWGQGREEMILTPVGNRGNYFSQQQRRASRLEWLSIFSFKPITNYGTHYLKLGSVVGRTTNRGEFLARAVNILDLEGRPLQRIEFTEGRPFNRSDLELAFFGQDHWLVRQKLAFDMGLRFERQGITETLRFAPRLGLAWAPFAAQRSVVRGGIGIFYDRVPLNVYSFDHYPEQVVTSYGPNGAISDGPRRWINFIAPSPTTQFAFVAGKQQPGNFAPYSVTWNTEFEHSPSPKLRLRLNYLRSNSNGTIIITPREMEARDVLALSGQGKSRYRQVELTARYVPKDGYHFFFSYVHSQARGDVNEFNGYLGNFPFPVVRPNQYANLPADLPHRFLTWAVMGLPKKVRFSYITEYRNGFPFAAVDARQQYVGEPYSDRTRFPNFFSLDTRLSKDFQVHPKYAVRITFRIFNLTNHFNPQEVHRNIADPRYGIFIGNQQRRFMLDFDLIF